MKNAAVSYYLLAFCLLSTPFFLSAQSFYGITNQGLHTISLNFGLEDNPRIGIGYNYRDFNPTAGNAVLDWQFELQLSKDLNAYKISAGLNYVNLDNDFQNSWGLGLGAHAFVQSDSKQDDGQAYAGLDFSAYPGYFNNRLSFAPKIGYRVGTLLNTKMSIGDDSESSSSTFGDNSKIGASINLNHNHLYAGVLLDGSFNATFPSRFSLGVDADAYRKALLDGNESDIKEEEIGQRFWLKARISTSF